MFCQGKEHASNALGTCDIVLSGLEARSASHRGDGTGPKFGLWQMIQAGRWFEITKGRNDFCGWVDLKMVTTLTAMYPPPPLSKLRQSTKLIRSLRLL